MQPSNLTFKRLLVGLVLVVGMSGGAIAEEYDNPRDPWEGYNRGMFAINETLDMVVAKPIAKAYEFIFPEPIRILVTNVFSNLSDVVIGINDLLQGRGEQAVNDFGRVVINTTLGFGGLFDVAGNAGWYKNANDFGVTFGRWGAPSGPYFVLPILGPSNIRHLWLGGRYCRQSAEHCRDRSDGILDGLGCQLREYPRQSIPG